MPTRSPIASSCLTEIFRAASRGDRLALGAIVTEYQDARFSSGDRCRIGEVGAASPAPIVLLTHKAALSDQSFNPFAGKASAHESCPLARSRSIRGIERLQLVDPCADNVWPRGTTWPAGCVPAQGGEAPVMAAPKVTKRRRLVLLYDGGMRRPCHR